MRQDFYVVLGVSPAASADEIRQAFRQLARQYHPDANAGSPSAAEYFKVINEAYRVLGTPQLRAAYDQALRIVRTPQPPPPNGASQAHIPTPPRAAMPHAMGGVEAAPKTGPRPGAGASPRMTYAPVMPSLTLAVTPAQPNIVPPREFTRFYVLTELGPTRESAILDPLPLDLALTVDRSSSMKGAKLFEVKRSVLNLLDQLRAEDLLTLVFFDNKPEVLADGQDIAGRAGIETALDRLAAQGGTTISGGLAATLERLMARHSPYRVSSLVLLTDGHTYGDEARCYELASNARDRGISITALGMGLDWNRELLDRLAAISGGSSNFVENPHDLQTVFDDVVLRLRATLASGMRMTLTPSPGVRIARVTRVAPEIVEAFAVPADELASLTSSEAVTVDLGALVGRPDAESAAVIWEVLLDPQELRNTTDGFDLGKLSAVYWAPRQGGGQMERLEHTLRLPVNPTMQPAPIERDVRLALELITAYRLQSQADKLKIDGKVDEAVKRMDTAALRLQHAGSEELADKARQAAKALTGTANEGVTETLRVKYGTKNLGIFHRLRRRFER